MSQAQAQTKNVPMRTCIGTGVKKPKQEMIRLVKVEDQPVKVDPSGRERGRGANIDSNIAAFEQAVKRHAIQRALKLTEKLTQEDIVRLREEFLKAIETKNFRKGNQPVTIRVTKDQLIN